MNETQRTLKHILTNMKTHETFYLIPIKKNASFFIYLTPNQTPCIAQRFAGTFKHFFNQIVY